MSHQICKPFRLVSKRALRQFGYQQFHVGAPPFSGEDSVGFFRFIYDERVRKIRRQLLIVADGEGAIFDVLEAG